MLCGMVDVRYYDIGDVPYGYQEVSMNKEAIVSSKAPAALGPYSSAVKVGIRSICPASLVWTR